MLPNNLKEKEIILTNSDSSSRSPTKEKIGFFRVKNFEKCCLNPKARDPKRFTEKTAMAAKAMVKFKSLEGGRNIDMKLPFCKPTEPMPGIKPSQFDANTKRKIVAIKGRYFSASLRSGSTESMNFNTFSTTSSRKFCIAPGTRDNLERVKIAKVKSRAEIKKEVKSEFVTEKLPILKISSAFK